MEINQRNALRMNPLQWPLSWPVGTTICHYQHQFQLTRVHIFVLLISTVWLFQLATSYVPCHLIAFVVTPPKEFSVLAQLTLNLVFISSMGIGEIEIRSTTSEKELFDGVRTTLKKCEVFFLASVHLTWGVYSSCY